MAVQGFFFRTSTLIANSRLLLCNRLPQLNQVSGIKKKATDTLKDLNVPEKPKRPLTPYFRFIRERRVALTKQYPTWKITQIAVQCASEWKTVDPAIKTKYENDYKVDMEQHAKKYAEYVNNLTDEQKEAMENYKTEVKQAKLKRERRKKLRDCEKPKRPMGGYMMYISEQAKVQPKKTFVELMGELKETWANMPAGEKARFNQMATKAKQQYDEDLKKWELQMIQEGNLDIVRQSTLTGKPPKSVKRE